MNILGRLISALVLWLGISFSALAIEPVYSDFFGKAIRGYDPVAYFTEQRPVKGSDDLVYEWNGADWHFSSQANLDKFQSDPDKFAPQYGGYCAWAVSKGYTAKIDPSAWSIYQGKLYLNYSRSVKQTWEQDIPGNVKSADKNWPKLLTQ
ncbi:YHS domain-containing (seleno)protein [Vibrio maerlii]|uniref:YHS domain-containing (seleno)protein n=1 Tax=Vibrio maerlii TaxID=2231648 RepID=UPI000E3D2587|nr:YHS domain-containing (seleno)protein [Vibrio maerlii]